MRSHRTSPPIITAVVSAAIVVCSAGAACAQSAPAPMGGARITALDATMRREIIDTMAARLRRHYVDADTGKLIADRVLARLAAHAYDSLTSPQRFAEVVTVDLRSVNGDKHLVVVYNPESPGQRPGPEGIRMFGPAPSGPPGPGTRGPPPGAAEAARRAHYNLGRVDILPGNIGYFDIRGFAGGQDVNGVIVSALKYLEGTDAIIFDVRRNGGGSPSSVNQVISHFTTSDTIASLTVKNRSGNETFTRYTLASVAGPRRPTVPLYVLTSGVTASAAEDFTFVLKNMKRATIVGAWTAGAGHNNAFLDVGHGFSTSISFTRVMDPRTGKEWERTGVEPDVQVDQAKALDVAHSLALKTLAAQEQDPRRRRVLDLMRETLDAQLAPRTVPAATLAGYVGEYEGGRSLAIDGGRLTISGRPGAPPDALVPMSETTFAFGANRFSFEPDGKGSVRLKITPPEGEALTYARTNR